MGVYTRKDYINLKVHLSHKLTSKRASNCEKNECVNYFFHGLCFYYKSKVSRLAIEMNRDIEWQ